MSWNLFLSLLELHYVSHTDFFRMGIREETNLELGALTQARTQMILHVLIGWLCATES